MTKRQETVAEEVRISPEEVKTRMLSGVPITMLDARNDKAWQSSTIKIRGADRIPPADGHLDTAWPKDRLTVVY